MFKRLLSILITTCLLAVNIQIANAFLDTNNEAVDFLYSQRVIDRTERFYPDSYIRRGEFVMWAMKNRDVFFDEGESLNEPFSDVDSQAFAPYVAQAWQLGALKTADKFDPLRKITRFEALKVLLIIEGVATPRAGFNDIKYDDLPLDSESRAIIAKALELRIIKSKDDNNFGTNDPVSRLEAAELLYNIRLSSHSQDIIFTVETQESSPKEGQEIFDEVWDIVHERYLYTNDVNDDDLMEGAISGMADSLGDPYTKFFPKQDTGNFLDNLEGSLEGIGAQVADDVDSGYILIVAPLKGTPAERAGLKSGDLITEVDEVDVKGMLLEDAINLIKGPAGTSVKLKILRDSRSMYFTVVRDKIELKSIYTSNKNGYLILEVDLFGSTTIAEFEKALAENMNSSTKGIILDLRGNPGGYLNVATDFLGYFFEPGTVGVITAESISVSSKKLNGSGELKNIPLAVIVDQYSASASEIVAGCIQDYDRGLIIGETTFGKGTVQELVQFYDGSSFKITVAEWKTPKKRVINGVGIEPDVIADPESDDIITQAIRRMGN